MSGKRVKVRSADESVVRTVDPPGVAVEREMTRKEAIGALSKGGLQLPAGYKFDRVEANTRPSLPRH